MSASDNNDLLQILNAHGQDFLNSFSLPTSSKKRKSAESPSRPAKVAKLQSPKEDDEEEWTGIHVSESEEDEEDTGSGWCKQHTFPQQPEISRIRTGGRRIHVWRSNK
jgi:hypothetical protein